MTYSILACYRPESTSVTNNFLCYHAAEAKTADTQRILCNTAKIVQNKSQIIDQIVQP